MRVLLLNHQPLKMFLLIVLYLTPRQPGALLLLMVPLLTVIAHKPGLFLIQLQCPATKGDVPDFDSTPVYQDTPSQSIDGMEEVTQEYMVQEQLSNYEKAHAARVAAHGEKLAMYYRKKETT